MAGWPAWQDYTADELAAQYSARDAVPEHPAIFQRWRKASADYRGARHLAGRARLAAPYGPDPAERLDLFLPDNHALAAPLHVFLHGGYWQSMSPEEFSWLAEGANAAGEAFAVLGYPLCPDVTLPVLLDCLQRGFDWLRDNADAFDIDMTRTHVSGHSAGGQLAVLLVQAREGAARGRTDNSEIIQVSPISGLFELEPLIHTPINGAIGLDIATARRLSPLFQPAAAGIRLEAWVGARESAEFQRQSKTFAEHWRQGGGDAHLKVASGCNHFTVLDTLFTPGGALCGRVPGGPGT